MLRVTARVRSGNRLTLPKPVRDALNLAPGDFLLFNVDVHGVCIENARTADDCFVTFFEWAGPADDEAYRDL